MNNDKKQSRINEAESAFNLLFGNVPAEPIKFGYLWTKRGEESKTFPFAVANLDERKKMAVKAIELNDAGFDVYYGVNLMDTEPAANARVKAEFVTMQTAVVTDIDTEGGTHISSEEKKYPPHFDAAKAFLPFEPSILINSGYGLHALNLFDIPITITTDNRKDCVARNKKYLEIIRSRAGGYQKAVDSVHDLPRILRVPGTFNYKMGKENAPLCHIFEVNDVRYTSDEMDAKLNALGAKLAISDNVVDKTQKSTKSARQFEDSPDFKEFKIRRMLDYISGGDYGKWLDVGMVLFNEGEPLELWEEWSSKQPKYTPDKEGYSCADKWQTFRQVEGYKIGSLCIWAVAEGYSAKQIWQEWCQMHPDKKPSYKKNIEEKMKRSLDDAIFFLEELTPENFTATDATKTENLHYVALAQAFGFPAQAQKFFDVIKAAQKAAKNRLNEAKEDLTTPLTDSEEIACRELSNVKISIIEQEINRQYQDISKQRKSFEKQQAAERAKAAAQAKAEKRQAEVEDNVSKLREMQKDYRRKIKDYHQKPTKELATEIKNLVAQMRALIFNSCDVFVDKYTGAIKSVIANAANTKLIFTFDPVLDGLIGYDEFQRCDVLLKRPPWRKDKSCIGEQWRDTDDKQLRMYLRNHYKDFNNEKLIDDALTLYSQRNSFNVVKKFFETLPKWDGKPRAETLFIKFLRVEDTPYAREVTLNWLTAAIARIYHPGCQYQLAIVLQGEQGIGKGYVLEKLGGKWYGVLIDSVDDPHAIDAIKNLWIVEIAEMASMRKAEINAIKSFISRAEDNRRAAYERRATKIPRQCVFAMTCNDKECLTDQTGNRRFAPLQCHSKRLDYVEGLTDDYIKQVWAEVFAHYNELFKDVFNERKLELSKDTKIKAGEIAELFTRDDGMTGEVKAFVDVKILPPIIWELLTREQRRDFHTKRSFTVAKNELIKIFENSRKKITPELQAEFDAAIKPSTSVLEKQKRDSTGETTYLTFIGSEFRQHICAAEIFNECFGNDKRKSMYRINEILENLDGWKKGNRIARDTAYGDQKNIFYREAHNYPNDDDDGFNNNVVDTPIEETRTEPTADKDFDGTPINSNVASPFDEKDDENDLPF